MRMDTPPHSPFNDERDAEDQEFNEEEMEIVIIGENDPPPEESSDEDGEPNPQNNINVHPELNPDRRLIRDDADLTFDRHEGSVFGAAIHPTEDWIVTGGEDDKAYVWNLDTGEVVYESDGHNDSVISTEFSHDGTYLATGDIAGHIQVFKVSQDFKKVIDFQIGDMVWMKWHKSSNILMAGGDGGEIYIWRIPSGDCKVFRGNGLRSEDVALTMDGKRLIAGYNDGTVKLWDIRTSTVALEIRAGGPVAHEKQVTCVLADPDCNSLFYSGSYESTILIAGECGPLGLLRPNNGLIEALAYWSDGNLKLLACGSFSFFCIKNNTESSFFIFLGTITGHITVWDISKQSFRMECEDPDQNGITRLLWLPECTIVAASMCGFVRGFDGRSGKQKVRF